MWDLRRPSHFSCRISSISSPNNYLDGVAAAIEVHLKAGDALLFVDAIMHRSAVVFANPFTGAVTRKK